MSEAAIAAQVEALCAQVGAFQVQIEALKATLDVYLAAPVVPQEQPACPHGNTKDIGSTLTQRKEKCLDCGAVLGS